MYMIKNRLCTASYFQTVKTSVYQLKHVPTCLVFSEVCNTYMKTVFVLLLSLK